jgi:hypothetical protein
MNTRNTKRKVLLVAVSTLFLSTSTFYTSSSQAVPIAYDTYVQKDKIIRPEIEQRRHYHVEQARAMLVQEAVAAVEETQKAVEALARGQHTEAVAAVDKSIGIVNKLFAQHSPHAQLPVAYEVVLVDLAPMPLDKIHRLNKAADRAIQLKHYPKARLLLGLLESEINVSISQLPLMDYSHALNKAASLLGQQNNVAANEVLLKALGRMCITSQVIPVPALNAEIELKLAEAQHDSNRDATLSHLVTARKELERAKELGYAGKDLEYANLSKEITSIEKKIRRKASDRSSFSAARQMIAAFLERQFEEKNSSRLE